MGRGFMDRSSFDRKMILGKSCLGKDLEALIFAKPGDVRYLDQSAEVRSNELRILIIAGQHGDEFPLEGIDQELMGLCAEYSRRGLSIAVIPSMNPDGAAKNTRQNAEGFDLNRDHADLRAAETRLLHRFMRDWRPHILLDLHTFKPERKALLSEGLAYCQDVLLEAANQPALPANLIELNQELLGFCLEEARKDGFLVDRYRIFSKKQRVRPSNLGIRDARNGVGLRFSCLSLLVERREYMRRSKDFRTVQTKRATLSVVRNVFRWAAATCDQSLLPPVRRLEYVQQRLTLPTRPKWRLTSRGFEWRFFDLDAQRVATKRLQRPFLGEMVCGPMMSWKEFLRSHSLCSSVEKRVLRTLERHELMDGSGPQTLGEASCKWTAAERAFVSQLILQYKRQQRQQRQQRQRAKPASQALPKTEH